MNKIRTVCVILLFLFVVPSCYAFESELSADPCETPAACIEKLLSIVDVDSSASTTPAEPELRVMKRLQSFGADAVPSIIPLLSKPNRHLARGAAKLLNDIELVDAQYIPQISRALDEHRIWLFPVLGRIRTAEAGEALVRYYLHQSSPGDELYDQLIENLKLMDGAIIPGLIKALQCEYGCERDTVAVLGKIASAMNEKVQVLISETLLRTAKDTEISYELRNSALSVMAYLGEVNLAIDVELLALAAEEKELALNIRFILGNSGSKHLVDFFINALNQVDDDENVYDAIVALSDLGVEGQAAGEMLIRLLEHKTTKIRIVAARTLGYIEYLPSAPQLVELASTDDDVRVAWAAVESLGRMHAASAAQDLQHIAESHWYPAVAAAAVKALAHINSGEPYKDEFADEELIRIPSEYFDFSSLSVAPCQEVSQKLITEDRAVKLYQEDAEHLLNSLEYEVEISMVVETDEPIPGIENYTLETQEDGSLLMNYFHPVTPTVALKIDGGWLAGSQGFEGMGEVMYLPDDGEPQYIMYESVVDIFRFDDRYIVVAGHAFFFINEGAVYELNADANGEWQATLWKELPGAPESARLVEGGELLINTLFQGSLLLDKKGRIRLAGCAD